MATAASDLRTLGPNLSSHQAGSTAGEAAARSRCMKAVVLAAVRLAYWRRQQERVALVQ